MSGTPVGISDALDDEVVVAVGVPAVFTFRPAGRHEVPLR